MICPFAFWHAWFVGCSAFFRALGAETRPSADVVSAAEVARRRWGRRP